MEIENEDTNSVSTISNDEIIVSIHFAKLFCVYVCIYVPKEEILEIKTEIDVDEHTLTHKSFKHEFDVNIKEELSTDVYEVLIKEELEDGTESSAPASKKHSVEKLLISHPEKFCRCVGIPNVETFNEIFDYIKDDLLEVERIPKVAQLFTTLVKLHLNVDNFTIDPHKFPAIYVSTIELLFEKFFFMWRLKLPLIAAPLSVQKNFPFHNEHLVVLSVLQLQVKNTVKSQLSPTHTVKYLIGYTNFGHIFYISKAFRCINSYVEFVEASGLLKKLNKNSVYIFEENGEIYSCSIDKNVPKLVESEDVAKYFDRITRKLTSQFVVFSDVFPEFMLRDTGNNSFLDKLVMVCCSMLNIDSFHKLNGYCAE